MNYAPPLRARGALETSDAPAIPALDTFRDQFAWFSVLRSDRAYSDSGFSVWAASFRKGDPFDILHQRAERAILDDS